MKKLIVLLLLVACQPSPEQIKKELHSKVEPIVRTYVKSLLQPSDKIDSLIVYAIDTLSTKGHLVFMGLEYLTLKDEYENGLLKKGEDYNYYRRLNDISYSATALEMMNDAKEKGFDLAKKMDWADSLATVCYEQSKTADSTNFLFYVASFRLKYSDVNNVQKEMNNGEVYLTNDFKIRERTDVYALKKPNE